MGHSGPVIATNNNITIIHCHECGFAHQSPLPDQAEIDTYYNTDQFYKTHSPADWFANEKMEYWDELWDTYYKYQYQLLNTESPIYDIGSGISAFASYHAGIGVVSIEPSYWARQEGLVKGVYASVDEAARAMTVRYTNNSARMALVLEHIPNPYQFCENIRRELLGCFGKVLLIVPNEMNPLQKKVQERVGYPWWISKVHINYWNKATIASFAKVALMRNVLYQGGTFPMELFYLAGYNYIGNDTVGRACHKRRLNFEKLFGVNAFRLYHLLYNKLGWGRESIIVLGYRP
jgi:hypothetical protein